MRCEDCFHVEICKYADYENKKLNKTQCEFFKNKSKTITVPCKVGDTVYKICRSDELNCSQKDCKNLSSNTCNQDECETSTKTLFEICPADVLECGFDSYDYYVLLVGDSSYSRIYNGGVFFDMYSHVFTTKEAANQKINELINFTKMDKRFLD